MLVATTASVEETRSLAGAIAELARPGDLLVLAGDLGAGKTAFVQGFGRALGVPDAITSPTFTIHREYQGRLTLHHLDVYRVGGPDDVIDLGLAELLDGPSVTVIEWGDTISRSLPQDYLEVQILLGTGDDDREVDLRTVGPRWGARSRALATAVADFLVGGPC